MKWKYLSPGMLDTYQYQWYLNMYQLGILNKRSSPHCQRRSHEDMLNMMQHH